MLGFQQFGLPTVLFGLGARVLGLRALRVAALAGRPRSAATGPQSLHFKLTGAMLAVLVLDGAGYLIAVIERARRTTRSRSRALEDIFVAVALVTITVGLVLPGMIAHSATQVAEQPTVWRPARWPT